MSKIFTALGLMSGTSMDGVDASIIKSDGHSHFHNIMDNYYKYDDDLQKKLINIRNLILTKQNLTDYTKELKNLEKEITIFHSKIIEKISIKFDNKIDTVGFHGQTIFHKPKEKLSIQLGDGYLLSQLSRKQVVYNFRAADLKNGGQGAPLTPIFHHLLSKKIIDKYKLNLPLNFLNIGGISNITKIKNITDALNNDMQAFDIGPGNSLIDDWIRKNSDKNFDDMGSIGKSGTINQLILNQAIENFQISSYNQSLDIKDFDISFVKGLSLEDGCATITSFTAYLIAKGILFNNESKNKNLNRYLLCGGGRKNNFLIKTIKEYLKKSQNIVLEPIDKYDLNGDYIESQAFAYLAIRSILKLPNSFPKTTGCNKPCLGGEVIKNF